MPNVAEVIRDHVTLAVECVDRLYLNAYVPGLQRAPGVVAFLRQRGQVIASPASFGEITDRFKSALQQYCSTRNIPWIEFSKGQDKDKLVESYRRGRRSGPGGRRSREGQGLGGHQESRWTPHPLHLRLADRVRQSLLHLPHRSRVGTGLFQGMWLRSVRGEGVPQRS